jgi:hypothetical protein
VATLLLLSTVSGLPFAFAQRASKRARTKGAPVTAAATTTLVNSGDVIISEFRLSGANGAADEFIELYNNTDTDIVVAGSNNSAGWKLLSSDGSLNLTIPNGDTIPARGHYLVVNADGYSLGGHPSGARGGATGDRSYTGDVPEFDVGIVLLRGAEISTLEDRLDAVGPTGETEAFYKEGNGVPTIPREAGSEYSFYRNLSSGRPADTDDNETDFILVSTNPDFPGARLGAPAPENTASPIQRNAAVKASFVDPQCTGGGSAASACARVRSAAGANPTNAAFGTLAIRRKFTNATTANVTRLRFRVIEISTTPEATATNAGTADLRALGASGNFNANTTTGGQATIQRLTLEQPPLQPLGGGFNSTLSANTITLGQPLVPGASINVEFLLGVQQEGNYRFMVNVEALP